MELFLLTRSERRSVLNEWREGGCRILIIQRRVKVEALLVGVVAVVMMMVSFCFLGAGAGARG